MRAPRSAAALALAATLTLTACGDDATTAETAPRTSTPSTPASEKVVLETSARFPEDGDVEGEVIAGSRFGDEDLCIGAKFRDRVVEGEQLIERRLRCSGGEITLGFTPDTGPGDGTQTGRWEVVDATGSYAGLEGSGKLDVVFTEADRTGKETFTGTARR